MFQKVDSNVAFFERRKKKNAFHLQEPKKSMKTR